MFGKKHKDAAGQRSGGTQQQEVLRCSFCNKSQNDVRKLIAGPDTRVYICDECVRVCNDILQQDAESEERRAGDEARNARERNADAFACSLCGRRCDEHDLLLIDDSAGSGPAWLCPLCVNDVITAAARNREGAQ